MYTKTKIPFPIFDIYYFKWFQGSKTKIHNHSKNGCLMFLLKGKLVEELYNKNIQLINKSEYTSPQISYINDKKGYHSIESIHNSHSIHIYYPKNHITKYYNK